MKNEISNEQYNEYVEKVTPTYSCTKNCIKAFLVGGIICIIGEGISKYLINVMHFTKDDAGSYVALILILSSVLLTGFNLYGRIARFGGAGALVPITGFANAVAAPAIEYQKEGQIFGIGIKIFTIAGPVILYGIFISWILGLGYWLLKIFSGGMI